MTKNNKPAIEKLTWKQARNDVIKANPQLAQEIDQLDPGDEYLLIKARYPFGATILDKGILYLPGKDQQLLSIDNSEVDPEIRAALAYAPTMPMGVVLNNSIELFLMEDKRIVPFSLMRTGKIFSIWSILQTAESAHLGNIWSITAGARSLIMLPKISDTAYYKKMQREFSLFSSAPKHFTDEWAVFKELAQCSIFPEPWTVEVIFFSGKWLERKTDLKWKLFLYYLLEIPWNETAFLRNQVIVDFAFSCALVAKNLKPNPYLTDTVKHLYSMGIGAYPGFIVAHDDSTGPIKGLQTVFNQFYSLKYSPTMFHLGYFSTESPTKPCYYSLALPTLRVFSPKSRKITSKLEDLREIKHIMNGISAYLLEDTLKLRNTPIYKWAKNINYSYFHSEMDSRESILNSSEIIKNDHILVSEIDKYPGKQFCASSPFLRGCIQISAKP